MVSEKVVVALIIVAILLSVVSIVVTISTVNTKLLPKPVLNAQGDAGAANGGQVSITVIPPTQ